MRLLLDANLSWRLANKLKTYFDDCFHVDSVGLNVPATDNDIWKYAQANDLIIVTNDDDYLNLANAKGFPPKVVLLRTGNQSNEFLGQLLIKHRDEINKLYHSTDYGFLEII